jgi:hypothetical protein
VRAAAKVNEVARIKSRVNAKVTVAEMVIRAQVNRIRATIAVESLQVEDAQEVKEVPLNDQLSAEVIRQIAPLIIRRQTGQKRKQLNCAS